MAPPAPAPTATANGSNGSSTAPASATDGPTTATGSGSTWERLYQQAANAPCFRVPLMWGLACGLAAGLHKFRIHRASPQAIMNACDFAVLGMGVSTSLGWWLCVRERRREEEELRRVMALQGFKPMSELPEEDR